MVAGVLLTTLILEVLILQECFVLPSVLWRSVALMQLDTESVSGVFSGA